MSRTVCTYPIVSAIRKADDIIGAGRVWHPGPELRLIAPEAFRMQARYLKDFHAPQGPDIAKIPEIESIASLSADEINRWLAERKFRITLNPFPEHGFGTASMLDVTVLWLQEGLKRPITLAGSDVRVPGVLLKPGVSLFRVGDGRTAAGIETKSGDDVFILPGSTEKGGLDLMDEVCDLSLEEPDHRYRGVHFPMVELDEQPDISWLRKLSTRGQDGHGYEIEQAKQQTKFKMNDKGARAKSAVAIGVVRTTSVRPPEPPPLVIDGPFTVWIERPGLAKPFFVGHITEENFKDPGSLEDM